MKNRMLRRLFIYIALLAFPAASAEAAIQCYECHGTAIPVDYRPLDTSYRSISSGAFPGNHRTHLSATASNTSCSSCHPGSDSYIASHRNGMIKISGRINGSPLTTPYHNTTSAFSQTATPTPGSCANVNCHFEATSPTWGTDPGLTTCTTCHGAPPAGTASSYTGGAAGSHAKHDIYYSGANNCIKCHADHTVESLPFAHATSAGKRGLVVALRTPANAPQGSYSVFSPITSYLPSQAASHQARFGSCQGTYCHGGTMDQAGDKDGGTNITPTWGNSATGQCGTCHGATSGNPPKRGSHRTHAGSAEWSHPPGGLNDKIYGRGMACAVCHNNYSPGHVNGSAEWSFDSGATPWLSGALYRGFSSGSASPVPGAYGQCTNLYCHSIVQSSTGGPLTGLAGEYKSPTWGNMDEGTCGSCHAVDQGHAFWAGRSGAPEIASGSHAKHLQAIGSNAGLGATPGGPARCAVCHDYANSDDLLGCATVCHNAQSVHVNHQVNIQFAPRYGGSGATYNGSPVPGSGFDGCSNTYCHSNGSSVASGTIPANSSPAWGSGTMPCNGCHGNSSYTDYRKAFPLYTNNRPGTKANNHKAHVSYSCEKCHYTTTTDGVTITNQANHVNRAYNVDAGSGATFTYGYNASGGSCSAISCHGTTNAQWGSTSCLGCHSVTQGNRVAITGQFGANSHHIQGTVTDDKCYQCHWEANSDGSINPLYHGGTAAPGSAVDLVVYGASRPASYSLTGTITAVQYHYTTNVNRAGVQKITTHCLGCHSDQNNTATPFGDGKTPKQYAWDGTSVDARYSQTGTTTWGKYTSAAYPNTARKKIDKAYSAHGNAASNQRGWDTTNGVDGTITNTSGTASVQCYDCHNSHGSTAAGITSRYSSATGRQKGAILKGTVAGKWGYSIAYRPYTGGSTANKNKRNPGASICLDCHMTQNAGSTMPWGYTSTFGASQGILGYWDSPYYMTYSTAGAEKRYPYMKMNPQGGHFGGASSPLSGQPSAANQINGLCTPCHDPHGVTDNTAKIPAADKKYAVPLLKGAFMTSPYKADVAPATTNVSFGGVEGGFSGASYPAYNIDQNTFTGWNWGSTTRVSEDVTSFGGLCLQCHAQSVLNPNAGSSNYAWRSMNRVHNTVKGWGGQGANAGNAKHSFTCSKCHAAHNSRMPRLMVTNCLDYAHRGRVVSGGQAAAASSGGSGGNGSGQFPGGGQGSGWDGGGWSGFGRVTCHSNTNPDNWPDNQLWNTVTPWGRPPTVTTPTATSIGATTATLGANATSNGGVDITARGTVWGTAASPTGNAVAEGGTTTGIFSHERTSITASTKIYYRGYAANSIGTGYSPDGSFYTEPATQASAVNFTAVGPAGMTVNWTRGSGDGVIVLMKQGSAVNSDPTDGTYNGYSANPAFGSGTQIGAGNYVVYKGPGTSVAVTGLNASSTYYLAVYEYAGAIDTSGVNQGTNYKPAPVTGSQATSAPTAPTLSSPTATSIGTTTATLGANVTTNGGAAITARGTVWGTSPNPTGNAVADGGTTTGVFSHARTAITAGTKIYYRGYATNSVGTAYSPDGSFYTEPATQASAVNFTAVGSTDMTVNWTRGSGGGVIVLMRQGAAVTGTPADGTYTSYTANPAFGSGAQIGAGNYVVYKGTGTSVTVTGLTTGTTYYLAVFEFAGQADTLEADQGTNYKPTPATGSQVTDTVPILASPTATAIGDTTATLGANVTSDGGAAITERGTVWGTAASPTGNAVAEGGTTTGIFSHARTSITPGTKIYYRGYATNSVGTAYSADGSFYTEASTQASAVNFTAVGDTGMTVNWTRGNGDGVIVLMRQGSAVATDPADGTYTTYTANAAFGSGTAIGPAYVVYKGTGTSVAVTGLSSGSTFHVAVYEYTGIVDTSGANQGTNYKPTAATGSQATSGLVPPNPPTLNAVTPCSTGICSESCQNTLTWNSGGGGDSDAKQYYVEMDTASSFNSANLTNSGWLAADITTWAPTVYATTWYWRVKARDSVHTTAVSEWSATTNWSFTDVYQYAPDCASCGVGCPPPSCPILFAWDGRQYSLETDIYPAGKLGNRDPSGFRKPNAHDYYLLAANPEPKDGTFELRLVEEKIEANYFDTLKLYTIDAPANRDVYSERLPITGGGYVKPGEVLHTTAKELKTPLSVKHVETGEDITGRLSGNEYVVFNKDRNYGFGWQTLEMDLGDLSDAPMIKLIIDGASSVPNNHEGHMAASKWPAKTRIQVLDEKGNWVTVPMKQRSILPRDGGGPLAINITSLFKTKVYKLRLQFLYKVYIRSIRFDTTADEPLIVREVPLRSAELQYHGHDEPVSAVNVKGEVVKYAYGNDSGTSPRYLPGYYTRFGDVTPLLKSVDDKFVIFGSGDEVVLRFDPVDQVRKGLSRRFLLYSHGYYKSPNNRNVPATVEPLPFSGMSNFPYDERVEGYPNDKGHQDYRDHYNTRLENSQGKEAQAIKADRVSMGSGIPLVSDTARRTELVKTNDTKSMERIYLVDAPSHGYYAKGLPHGNRAEGAVGAGAPWSLLKGLAAKVLALVTALWGWIAHLF